MQVELRENEPLERALRRFRRRVNRAGIMKELRKRRRYEKPSAARRTKSRAAQRRRIRADRRARRREAF